MIKLRKKIAAKGGNGLKKTRRLSFIIFFLQTISVLMAYSVIVFIVAWDLYFQN